MVLFRLRFFDDLKSTFITEWTLCKGKPFQTLLEFYSDIQNGDVKCGYSYENACSYDVDELWAEYAGSSKPQPVFALRVSLKHLFSQKKPWVQI